MAEEKEQVAETTTRPGEAAMSEDEIDRTLKETFPASDPPSWTLGTDHREDPPDEPGDGDKGSDAG